MTVMKRINFAFDCLCSDIKLIFFLLLSFPGSNFISVAFGILQRPQLREMLQVKSKDNS